MQSLDGIWNAGGRSCQACADPCVKDAVFRWDLECHQILLTPLLRRRRQGKKVRKAAAPRSKLGDNQ